MNYVIDTNGYRNLVHGKSYEEICELAKTLQIKDRELGNSAKFSWVVTMELMQHLHEDDSAFEDCFKALCLQVRHCAVLNSKGDKQEFDCIPPHYIVLSQYFCNVQSQLLEKFSQLIPYARDITNECNPEDCFSVDHKKFIELVSKQVKFDKGQMCKRITEYLSSLCDSEEPAWEYFKGKKIEQKDWFDKLDSGYLSMLMAESMIKGAYEEQGKNFERSETNMIILIDYIQRIAPALTMFERVLRSMGNSAVKMKDPDDKRWNTLYDISVMIGALLEQEPAVVVTADKPILENYKTINGFENLVMSFEDYTTKYCLK